MPTVVSQQGPLGTSAGSRGGGVAMLPFSTDELWWPSRVQRVMFFTTSSSASCNEETPPAKNVRKWAHQSMCFERSKALGFLLLPISYHPLHTHLLTAELQCWHFKKKQYRNPFPFARSSSPSQMESSSGHCEFWGASSLHPVYGGARIPARLVYTEGTSTPSTFLTF